MSQTTTRPIGELVEEVAQRLSSEQIHALAARVAAAEARPAERPTPFDLPTAVRIDLDGTIRRAMSMWCDGAGIDADLFASWYLPQLRRAGVDEAGAIDALHRLTAWRPRTTEERAAAVAADMLDAGYPAAVVREAVARAFAEESR